LSNHILSNFSKELYHWLEVGDSKGMIIK